MLTEPENVVVGHYELVGDEGSGIGTSTAYNFFLPFDDVLLDEVVVGTPELADRLHTFDQRQ